MGEINNESLLEIAVNLMKSKKKPKSLKEITNEVFQVKGNESLDDIAEQKAQFQVDFMVSGFFVCCGENTKGQTLWDLKSRQPSTLNDKDGNYDDLYADDEDVIKNELKEDIFEVPGFKESVNLIDDDIEEDDLEHDEIEEELNLVDDADEEIEPDIEIDVDAEEDDEITEKLASELLLDDEEDTEEELDDIEEALKK